MQLNTFKNMFDSHQSVGRIFKSDPANNPFCDMTSKNVRCNGCFASGINFAASIVSLLYGEGDYQETVKIATLAGWDSDNPAAT